MAYISTVLIAPEDAAYAHHQEAVMQAPVFMEDRYKVQMKPLVSAV